MTKLLICLLQICPLVLSGQRRIRTSEVVRQRIYSPPHLAALESAQLSKLIEPEKGLEPPTSWLQISCSTSWATLANSFRHQLSYGGQNNKELPPFFWEGKGNGICQIQKFCVLFFYLFSARCGEIYDIRITIYDFIPRITRNNQKSVMKLRWSKS